MSLTTNTAPLVLRFGDAQLDVAHRQLLINGQPAKLGARAFDVLLVLIERRQRAVTKDELFELVWQTFWSRKTTCRFISRPCASC